MVQKVDHFEIIPGAARAFSNGMSLYDRLFNPIKSSRQNPAANRSNGPQEFWMLVVPKRFEILSVCLVLDFLKARRVLKTTFL